MVSKQESQVPRVYPKNTWNSSYSYQNL